MAESLPEDVIVTILEYLSTEDALNLISTCKRFQSILSNYNKLWEKKFYESCPTARKNYNAEKQKRVFDKLYFGIQLKTGSQCIKHLQYYAFLLSKKNLTKYEKNQLENLLRSIVEDSMTYYYVQDEMNRMISTDQLNPNFTSRYYFYLLSNILKEYRFMCKFSQFLNKPRQKQLLEKLLVIMVQFLQPHITYSLIRKFLDDIAQEVLYQLKKEYPTHSIFLASSEQFSFWRHNNIHKNFWKPIEVVEIIRILEKLIFYNLNIFNRLLKTLNLEIDDNMNNKEFLGFLRKYFLAIIFHSVARRLGVHCYLYVNSYSNYIQIYWNPNYKKKDGNYTECVFIKCQPFQFSSVYVKNYIELVRKTCNAYFGLSYKAMLTSTASMISVFYRNMIAHDAHYMWKLSFLKSLKWCLMKNIKSINIETKYRNITRIIKNTPEKIQPKQRTRRIKFAVGMVVKNYQRIDYSTGKSRPEVGVIVGWHHQCDSMFQDKLKKTNMFPYLRKIYGCHICKCNEFLLKNFNQPHYIILCENNRISYIRQEHILKCYSPKLINNLEIGRYFSGFNGKYYIPNKSLIKQYPWDTAARRKLLQ